MVTSFGLFTADRIELQNDLLSYFAGLLPPTAFQLLKTVVGELAAHASSGKLTFGTEIHRLPPPDLVYDLDTGEPCGRVDCQGRVLPLLQPVARKEDVAPKNEAEVEILGY